MRVLAAIHDLMFSSKVTAAARGKKIEWLPRGANVAEHVAREKPDVLLIDLASPKLLQWITRRNMGKATAAGGAPMKFGPAEGTAFFGPSGWREVEWRSTGEEARRLRREMALAWLWRLLGVLSSAATRERWRRFAGFALLERT